MSNSRMIREKKTVRAMIQLYCAHHHLPNNPTSTPHRYGDESKIHAHSEPRLHHTTTHQALNHQAMAHSAASHVSISQPSIPHPSASPHPTPHQPLHLCLDCHSLYEYALQRLDRCPFQNAKPTCGQCPIHCYTPEERVKMQTVMRYAGPRMLLQHPLLTIAHLMDRLASNQK